MVEVAGRTGSGGSEVVRSRDVVVGLSDVVDAVQAMQVAVQDKLVHRPWDIVDQALEACQAAAHRSLVRPCRHGRYVVLVEAGTMLIA